MDVKLHKNKREGDFFNTELSPMRYSLEGRREGAGVICVCVSVGETGRGVGGGGNKPKCQEAEGDGESTHT